MLNVVVTLQQCCGNVLITSESDIVTTSETDVDTILILDHVTTLLQRVNNDVVTTLSQRCCASWERCKLVIIGKIIYSILYYFIGVVCAITRFVLGRHICAE